MAEPPGPLEPEPPALDEVLIAFQKSLGRARKSAMQYAQEELGFQVGGMQQVFGVGKMTVKLRGALSLKPAPGRAGRADRIAVDFAADPARYSEIEVELQPQAVQEVENGVVLLREAQAAKAGLHRFQVYVLQQGRPVPGAPVSVRVQRGDSTESFSAVTDVTGSCRIELKLGEKTYDLALQGGRPSRTKAGGAGVSILADAGSAGVSRAIEIPPSTESE